jgi:hypothetical protein
VKAPDGKTLADTATVLFAGVSDPDVPDAGREAVDHRRSHQRIPSGDLHPRLRRFRRYEVVAP